MNTHDRMHTVSFLTVAKLKAPRPIKETQNHETNTTIHRKARSFGNFHALGNSSGGR